MRRVEFSLHLLDRIISLREEVLDHDLNYPRHFPLKCLYQATKVCGSFYSCNLLMLYLITAKSSNVIHHHLLLVKMSSAHIHTPMPHSYLHDLLLIYVVVINIAKLLHTLSNNQSMSKNQLHLSFHIGRDPTFMVLLKKIVF